MKTTNFSGDYPSIGLGFPERASLAYGGGEVSFRRPPYETRSSAIKRITTLLGGHAAETLIFDNTTNGSGLGAASDLALATEMAGKMLFEWGMGASLMHTPFRKGSDLRLSDRIDRAVEETLQDCFQDALRLSEEHINNLHAVANVLLEERELSGNRCKALLRDICPNSQVGAIQGRNVTAVHKDR